MNGVLAKVGLYILSLGLLFLFFLIISATPSAMPFEVFEFSSWKDLLSRNIFPSVSVFGLVCCVISYRRFNYLLKGAVNIPFQISKLENINYEHLTFLATYVVPLISFDFSSGRQLIVLTLLLVVMGIIYIKTDLFYANPSLALLGYRIYKADGVFKNETKHGIILICRGALCKDQKVSYIKLDDRIFYVKGV